MISDKVSAKYVVTKVFRDLNVQNDNWVIDAFEWMGEAIEHIGSGVHFDRTLAVLPVQSYRATMPADVYNIIQVAYNVDDYTLEPAKDHNIRAMPLSGSNNHPGLYEDPTLIPEEQSDTEQSYYIEGNQIKTSYESGWVVVIYNAIETDDEGYPLVPDNISFKEALFWYILKKLIMGGNNPQPQAFNYEYADQKWKYYCTQARNALKMPDMASYREFRENWVRLIPDTSRFDNLFDPDMPGVQKYGIGTWIDALDALGDSTGGINTFKFKYSVGPITVDSSANDLFINTIQPQSTTAIVRTTVQASAIDIAISKATTVSVGPIQTTSSADNGAITTAPAMIVTDAIEGVSNAQVASGATTRVTVQTSLTSSVNNLLFNLGSNNVVGPINIESTSNDISLQTSIVIDPIPSTSTAVDLTVQTVTPISQTLTVNTSVVSNVNNLGVTTAPSPENMNDIFLSNHDLSSDSSLEDY